MAADAACTIRCVWLQMLSTPRRYIQTLPCTTHNPTPIPSGAGMDGGRRRRRSSSGRRRGDCANPSCRPAALVLLLVLLLAPATASWGVGSLLLQSLAAPWRLRRRLSSTRLFAGVEPDEPVPFSSRQMSAVRALEAERPDRLFSDPLSFHFAGEEAMRQARERANASRASQGVGRKIAVRTRFFDDFLLDCCTSSNSNQLIDAVQQVLILGCGMDTRAWRLPLNGTVVVEVDVPAVLRAKDGVLRQVQVQRKAQNLPPIPLTVGRRVPVPADFGGGDGGDGGGDDWVARVKAALDPAAPVAVVMEGLLMYLDEGEVRRLLARVAALAAAPGSRVGISLVDTRSVQDAQRSSSPLRRTWRWGCDEEECRAFFEGALGDGWRVSHVTRVGTKGRYPAGANYACWADVGKWRRVGKTLYVLAERRKEGIVMCN